MSKAPTIEQTAAYQAMFDHFNRALFAGSLRHVILNFSRHAGALGFFAPERWSRAEEKRHEISLNPEHMGRRPSRDVAGTLVHEMCHLWQQEAGKPSARGYHNREWAAKMETVGLMPSSTAAPGGAKTGFRMSHYIIDGGPFARAFDAMPAACSLPWAGNETAPTTKRGKAKSSKVKYTCPSCGLNAWGKPGLAILCEDDNERLTAENAEGEEDDDE